MAAWTGFGRDDGDFAAGVPGVPPHFVPRPRLDRLLADAVDTAPVTQVVAPAVSGKTTLISGWYASGTSPDLAYVGLTEADNDPAHFWRRIATALRWLRPSAEGRFVSDLTAVAGPPEGLLANLAAGDRVVLVLDAVDFVDSTTVTTALAELLLDLPEPLRVVLLFRSERHVRQGLLRARDQLVEIHADELAFDREELDAYLGQLEGVSLAEDDADLLLARTEGWIGAVKLAGLSLAQHRDPSTFVAGLSGSSRYLADLFAEEILDPQPQEVRDFLLVTSVLDELDDGLCNLVTGGTDGAARLDHLQRSGMFVEQVDDDRSRFRYRQLFGEFLRHRLHLLDPQRERAAHRAAAEGYEYRGDPSAAIRHFVAADRPGDAVRLIVTHGERCAAMGQVEVLREWLTSWPADFLTNDLHQMLDVARLCVMAGMRDESVTRLSRVRWRIEATGDPTLLGEHALLSGFAYAMLGNLESAVSEGHRVLMLAERGDGDATLTARAHHLLAEAYAGLDEFDLARRHRDAAPPDEQAEVPVDGYSAWLCYREGSLDRSVEHANRLLANSSLPWQWGIPLVARGGVRRERNQLGEAEIDLERALRLARRWSRPRVLVFCGIELALLRFAQGRIVDAYEILTEARPEAHSPTLRQRIDLTQAALWLEEGDVERCAFLRREIPDGPGALALDVRIHLATEEFDKARASLAGFKAQVRSRQDEINEAILGACVVLPDDEAAARASLERAIELGRGEGFVQTFLDDLRPLDGLMRRIAAETDDPYVFGLQAAMAARYRSVPVLPALVEPLSSREEIVLRYLQTSLSNKAIADELHMSVNTLKTHLKNVYRKLGVGSRAEAVATARQLHVM